MYHHGIKIILVALLVNTANGAADCSKPPNFENFRKCCKVPEPNLPAFKDKCGSNNLPTSRQPSPCYLECIFNTSKVFDDENLNMENLRTMLTTLFDGKQEFVDAYAIAFEKCDPVIKQRVASFKAKHKGSMPKGPNMPNCPLWATFYAICAHKNVFIACPESAWTSSKDCEVAKEYASTCEPHISGPGGRRGGSGHKRGRRETTETENVDPNQMPADTDVQTQQMPGRRGQGQRRGQGRDQRQNMGQGMGMGQRQGNGQGMGRGMGQGQGQANGQGMGRNMGQGNGQNMGQYNGQRMGRGMGQGQGQGQGQGLGPNGRRRNGQRKDSNQENMQTTVQEQQRRKRDLSHQEIFDLIENWIDYEF